MIALNSSTQTSVPSMEIGCLFSERSVSGSFVVPCNIGNDRPWTHLPCTFDVHEWVEKTEKANQFWWYTSTLWRLKQEYCCVLGPVLNYISILCLQNIGHNEISLSVYLVISLLGVAISSHIKYLQRRAPSWLHISCLFILYNLIPTPLPLNILPKIMITLPFWRNCC